MTEPVAWRYQRKEGWGDIWRSNTVLPTFESPEEWTVQPLYASPALQAHDALVEECAKIAEGHVGAYSHLAIRQSVSDIADQVCRDIANAIRDAHGGNNE